LRADVLGAAYPEWAPDGQHVLFLGKRDEKPPIEESIDWWVTPLNQGPAIATDAFKATREEKLSGPLIPSAWDARSSMLVFSAGSGDSTNLWRIGISSRTRKYGRPPAVPDRCRIAAEDRVAGHQRTVVRRPAFLERPTLDVVLGGDFCTANAQGPVSGRDHGSGEHLVGVPGVLRVRLGLVTGRDAFVRYFKP
jgi:hypothetical protein